MSAVSKKLRPASRAASTTAAAPFASVRQPKLLQPMPTTETFSEPILRNSMRRNYNLKNVAELTTPAPCGATPPLRGGECAKLKVGLCGLFNVSFWLVVLEAQATRRCHSVPDTVRGPPQPER